MLLRRREDVENATAHRYLTPSLHKISALIAKTHQRCHDDINGRFVSRTQDHRRDIGQPGHDWLLQGAHRGHQDVDRLSAVRPGVREAAHDGNTTTHGVGGW